MKDQSGANSILLYPGASYFGFYPTNPALKILFRCKGEYDFKRTLFALLFHLHPVRYRPFPLICPPWIIPRTLPVLSH